MRRVVVVGCPGAGKTTLAANLASALDLHHIELDELFHGPGWTQRSEDEFRAGIVAEMEVGDSERGGWVICGNYNSASGGIHLAKADTVVWLDLPRSVVMARVMKRTVVRGVLRTELWNGNREPFSNFVRWDPDHNIVRWAWVNYPKYLAQYSAKLTEGSWDHVTVHRLRSADEVNAFLASSSTT